VDAWTNARAALPHTPRHWLVTGAAGFIGSHLVEALLALEQRVTGLDNFSTGRRENVDDVQSSIGPRRWSAFRFIEADIRDPAACARACEGVDFVLHQAALGSVPRSIADPCATHASNVTGFLNMLAAARDAHVQRFVYASSSSVYGDHPALPKVEHNIGAPLSPYAVSKLADEQYAGVFARCFGTPCIGLRYFNVFGPRQDPQGPYSAVVPQWFAALLEGRPVRMHGDGSTSRDFCHVHNVVQANVLAALASSAACNQVYNVAVGERATLAELLDAMCAALDLPPPMRPPVEMLDFRPGDIRHSQADIGKARRLLGYEPTHRLAEGLRELADWHRSGRGAGR
jgi:UDP-N-acetylglucosamine 4-epimerase